MQCSHCHLEYDRQELKHIKQNGQDLYFCCAGCESVYHILSDSGFEGFYERLGSTTLSPPKSPSSLDSHQQDFSYLNHQEFLDKNTKKIQNNYEVSLIIEGIHCAACIWLNENILGAQKGIKKVHINYTNNKAKILFDPQIIPLSRIFELIESIGYSAHIYDPSLQERQINKQKRSFFISFVVGVFCTMNIMWIAVAQYAGYFSGMSQDMKDVLNLISCLLAIPVLFFTGRVFFVSAYYGLKHGFIGMDFLVAFGASLTFIYSLYAAISRSGETYFESVAMIILFVFSGKFLEMRAKSAAGDSLDGLHCIMPSLVSVESSGKLIQKDVKLIKKDEIIRIKPGEMLACDGILLDDYALLDMKSLSGESMPIKKEKNQEVLSGSIALESGFRYKVSKPYESSIMCHIINLLEESLHHKPYIQNLANSLSQNFSRSVLFIVLCAFIGWYLYDRDFEHALIIAISVVVISCPCALALATPIASVVGIAKAYKNALLFKEARFLESIAKAKVVFLDKTGTLTKGKPKLYKQITLKSFDENLLYNFLSYSTHPISKALLQTLSTNAKLPITNFSQINSKGICAQFKNQGHCQELIGGSIEFLKERRILHDENLPKDLQDFDMSVFGYAIDSELVALFFFEDELKDGAKEFITYLKRHNKTPIILSGDRYEVVANLAKELEIATFYANLLPEQKSNLITEQQKSGEQNVMIGDGLNDILALQQANVGISMGAGSDVAIACSDVVILDDSLKNVQKMFEISLTTYKRIKQNIALSIVYNALMIPLALAGFIIPLIAALSMSLSSLLVVGNSMRK